MLLTMHTAAKEYGISKPTLYFQKEQVPMPVYIVKIKVPGGKDVFKIDTENYTKLSLRKVYTKKFQFIEHAKFQWGGGIYLTESNRLKVFLCGSHIKEESKIIMYE